MTKPRRRQAGEGGISQYETQQGTRYLIKYRIVVDGVQKVVLTRGFATRKDAAERLRTLQVAAASRQHPLQLAAAEARLAVERAALDARMQTVEAYLNGWLDGLRLAPSTVASYRKNVRLHVIPHLGTLRLDEVTGTHLTRLYRQLEAEGREDGAGGLSPRTVRYVATIVGSAFRAAVLDELIPSNPVMRSKPPTAREARSPEMRVWNREQLTAFLDWSRDRDDDLRIAWLVLAMTAVRRGEALALRWRDVDFDAGTIAVRRSVTVVKRKGAGERLVVGLPKSGKPRVIDVDPETMGALRSWRARLGAIALTLAAPDGLVLGTLDGEMRHPERFSRAFVTRVRQAQRAIPDLPSIRLHDVRHSSATLMLQAGVHPKIVSERLGHAKVSITLDVYSHVVPSLQREAASKLAQLVYGGID